MHISTIFSEQGTVHSSVDVVKRKTIRMMRFGKRGGWQGAFDEAHPERPVFPYQRAFQCVAEAVPDVADFLSIGVGTGTALNSVLHSHPQATLYAVEIDETVLRVALEYFQAPSYQRVNYWIGDGFAFVRAHAAQSYGLVLVDAYMPSAIYQPALAVSTLDLLASRLRSNGVLVYNVIAPSLRLDESERGAFLRAAKLRFQSVIDFPVGFPYSDQNRLLILSDDKLLYQRLSHKITTSRQLPFWERLMWPWRLVRL